MRDRHGAGGDHRGAAGRRSAGGVVGIPGIARDIDGGILRRTADPEFRRGGASDQVEAGAAYLPGHERIGCSAVAAHDQRAHFLQPALHRRAQILHQEWKSGKRPIEGGAVGGGVYDGILEDFDDGRKRRIHLGDAGGCLRCQLGGGQFALADARRQRHAIMLRPFVPTHRQSHAIHLLGTARTLEHDPEKTGTGFGYGVPASPRRSRASGGRVFKP
jgi:hypothetical protein